MNAIFGSKTYITAAAARREAMCVCMYASVNVHMCAYVRKFSYMYTLCYALCRRRLGNGFTAATDRRHSATIAEFHITVCQRMPMRICHDNKVTTTPITHLLLLVFLIFLLLEPTALTVCNHGL